MQSVAAHYRVSRVILAAALVSTAFLSAGNALAAASAQPPAPPTPPAPATRPASPSTRPASSAQPPRTIHKDPVITIIDRGAEPRQTLRIKPATGASTFEMVLNMKAGGKMGAAEQPVQPLPGVRLIVVMNVTDVKSNGDIAYKFEYARASVVETPGVPADMVARMRKSVESLAGSYGSGVFSDRAFPRETSMTLAQNADPAMRQQIDQLAHAMNQMWVPLPEEPVGVGGRWSVKSDLLIGGIALTMTSEVALRSIEGNVFTLTMSITQKGDPQDMKSADLPAGAKVHLHSMKAAGEGTSKINPVRIVPVSAESTVISDTDMTVNMAGMPRAQNMTQHLENITTLKDITKPATTKPAARP